MTNETKKFKWTAVYQEDFANYKFEANEANIVKSVHDVALNVYSLIECVADLVNNCSNLWRLDRIIESANDIQKLTEPRLHNDACNLFYHQRKFELNKLIWLKAVEILENTIDLSSQSTSEDLKHIVYSYFANLSDLIDQKGD
jgi:hypothetical protein